MGATSLTRRSAPKQEEPHFAWSGKLCGYRRLRPQPTRPPPSSARTPGPNWRAMVFAAAVLYFAAVPGPGTLGSGFRKLRLTWVELWGFEPQTSCMPYSGTTSTAVHLCRSPSQDVRINPPESRPVAVLSCCAPQRSAGVQGRCLTLCNAPLEISRLPSTKASGLMPDAATAPAAPGRTGGMRPALSSCGGSGEVRGGRPELGSCVRGRGTGRVLRLWLRCWAERGGPGGNPADVGGFRGSGLYSPCVHFVQPAGRQPQRPAQGKRRRLRCAHWHVERWFHRSCSHGRGPAEARHGTERHGECRQRRQDVHDDCRSEVAGPAPSQHRQPDLAVPAPGLGQRPGRGHHHLP
jgi:hypothetical protein